MIEKKFTDFYEAWWFLVEHPAFYNPLSVLTFNPQHDPDLDAMCYGFHSVIDIDFQKVNPETEMIDDDSSKNTKVECWLECGGMYLKRELQPEIYDSDSTAVGHYNDPDLDCGGDTFEEAIINMANLVAHHYQDDGVKINSNSMFYEKPDTEVL